MGVRACCDGGHTAYDSRIDNINKDPLDRQFGREMGGWLNRAAK